MMSDCDNWPMCPCGREEQMEFVFQDDAAGFMKMALARSTNMCYLDRVGSVSALVEVEGSSVWDDEVLEDQHRRFING